MNSTTLLFFQEKLFALDREARNAFDKPLIGDERASAYATAGAYANVLALLEEAMRADSVQ